MRVADALVRERGVSRKELAARFDVSVTTVMNDERMIRKEWREARLANADALLAQDLAELGMVKSEAWRVYESSTRPRTTRTKQISQPLVVVGEGLEPSGANGRETDTATELTPVPNLKALELVTRCLEQRRELLGIGVEKEGSRPRVFAFTVKIGDRVLASGATADIDAEDIDVDDAEYYEVEADGRKRLASRYADDEGGGVQ